MIKLCLQIIYTVHPVKFQRIAFAHRAYRGKRNASVRLCHYDITVLQGSVALTVQHYHLPIDIRKGTQTYISVTEQLRYRYHSP